MTKLKLALIAVLLILKANDAWAQQDYLVHYVYADSGVSSRPELSSKFSSRITAIEYITALPAMLGKQGYVTSSLDSVTYDSVFAIVHIYLGDQYKWAAIRTDKKDETILEVLRWRSSGFTNKAISFSDWKEWQNRIINYLEDNGHPFAKVYLDSLSLDGNSISGLMKIEPGPLHSIDSIRVYGDVDISNAFLQRYLNIPNGSLYSKSKLSDVSRKLSQLPYVVEERPSNVSVLATGSVLNLYLQPKKTSLINAIIGFLPNSEQGGSRKFQLAVDANIMLRNALGEGETIGLNWQKLQPESQRLHVLYEHPYVLKTAFGLGFDFEMFRKDSSFLNIDMKLAAQYGAGEVQSASVFLLRRQTIVNVMNTNQILFTRRLPDEADVSSNNLGVSYLYNNTDYRFNPRKGNEFSITSSAGIKKVKKNNQVVELKDPNNPSFNFESLYDTIKLKAYQFRVQADAAHYFPLGKQSALRTGIYAGWFSSGNIFRNELFQIGGYKLLRGFDEESQYVSQYTIGSIEYRYLVGQNSKFFVFADGGWAKGISNINNTYLGTGLGMSFETKAGIFNLVWAVGKRDDTDFNLRQSKVHLGFVNYF